MPVAYIDRVDLLALTERQGAIRALTRRARVIFRLPPDGDGIPSDFTILLQALTAAGVPVPFSTLDVPGTAQLTLVEREVKLVDEDKGTVDIDLRYEHLLDGPNQQYLNLGDLNLGPLLNPSPTLFGKGKASISQKTTNFYYPNGDTTIGKQQILVGHTWFTNEQNNPGVNVFPNLPQTQIQGGEISVPFPEANFHIEGVYSLSPGQSPWSIAWRFIAKININTWAERPPLTWMCSEVSWEMFKPAQLPFNAPGINSLYKFSFEFQYNFDTWQPEVVFTDQSTGRPPAFVEKAYVLDPIAPGVQVLSLVFNPLTGLDTQPAGYWRVPYFAAVSFDQLFAAIFE